MSKVRMYCTAMCPYCSLAEKLLTSKGIEIQKIRIDETTERMQEMIQLTGGRRTVPQIFIGDTHVGGYDELVEMDFSGDLDELLNQVTDCE